MIRKSITFTIILLLAMPATAATVTKVEIRGGVYDQKEYTNLTWDAQRLPGFWYNFGGGKQSETLTVNQSNSSLNANSRTIQKENLLYYTSRTDAKFGVFSNANLMVENGLEYNSSTGFIKNTTGGWFARLGWFGDQYVAVNGKANKLAKLLVNHGSDIKDKKRLKLAQTWELGEGFNLTVEALDTKTSPRQAWLSLSQDGKILDNKVVNEGEVYTYIEKRLKDESDVPIFVTYIESIFAGTNGTGNFVQFRYTWLISENVLEIKEGDRFGVFEVKEATEDHLLLYNKDKSINLDQNTVQQLYGDLKFKVADSSAALRFYPFVERIAPIKYEVRGGAYDQKAYTSLVWDAQRFPGFWYNFGGGKQSETLIVNQSNSSLNANSRVIQQENLLYNTSRTDAKFGIFSNANLKVENGLEYNSSTGFIKNATGGWFARLGWFGDQYVAVNGKANKLAKLLVNHGSDIKDKKTLKLGATWEFGEGYNLTAQEIDAKSSPRQARLILSIDGTKLDDKIITEGEVYTYLQKNLAGESDVPVLATYVESIFSGDAGDIVQLRYTWLISQNVLEIKAGEKFGVFEVKEATEDHLLLYNKEKSINLDQNTVQPLYGDLKFKVADSSTALRFYPFVEQTIPDAKAEPKDVNITSISVTATATSAATPAFTAQQSSLNAASPSGTLRPVPTKTQTPIKTQGDTAKPMQWNWVLFALVGLITTGYLVLRRV